MTTIAMLVEKEGLIAAWDNMATVGENRRVFLTEDKVFQNGPYVIAVAGTLRGLQALKAATLPVMEVVQDEGAFMFSVLMPRIREVLIDAGEEPNENGSIEIDVVVAFNGRAFDIGGLSAVVEREDGHYVLGSGSDYALGALYAGALPDEAVRIAAIHDTYTGERVRSAVFEW